MIDNPANKRVLIIGGASSVGQAVVRTFESNGTPVLATYNHKKISLKHSSSQEIRLDFTDINSISTAAAQIKEASGSLSTAIFISSILPGKNLDDYDAGQINDVLQVNFIGQAELIKAIRPAFGAGSQILMISSISAQRGSFDPIYAASKGAILSFVKSLARGMNGRPRVNALMPGLIRNSGMYLEMEQSIRERHVRDTATGALLELDDFAKIILDMTQPHWASLNGACIPINGGAYV